MENTYFATSTNNNSKQKTLAIVMAFIAIAIGLGISIYYAVRIFNESAFDVFDFIAKLSKAAEANDSGSNIAMLLEFLIIFLIAVCFAFPLTTIILGLIVLITKGQKKTTAILMYAFIALTILFFLKVLIK